MPMCSKVENQHKMYSTEIGDTMLVTKGHLGKRLKSMNKSSRGTEYMIHVNNVMTKDSPYKPTGKDLTLYEQI